MQAEGFLNSRQRHPFSLTAAIAINVGAVGAVMLAKNDYIPNVPTILIGRNIPLPKEPPPLPEKPQHRAKVLPVDSIKSVVTSPPREDSPVFFKPVIEGPIDIGDLPAIPFDPPAVIDKHVPVLVGARPDPRFARELQPSYPPGKQRLNEEGSVTVRILVGADGGVKQIEPVGTVDPDFWKATQRQALARWRFTPATRDGAPYDSWRQMTVRFQLNS